MAFILYGGPKEVVEKQLKCEHDWYGPCSDIISRYNKCTKCYCLEYDCTWKEYIERTKENDNKNRISDNAVYVLEKIIEDLPVNKDWLDPSIERWAKKILEEYNQ